MKRREGAITQPLGTSRIADDAKSSSSDDDSASSSPGALDGRRNRTAFSTTQLEALETAFRQNTYPDTEQREEVARLTGLSEDKIMVYASLLCQRRSRRGSATVEPVAGRIFLCWRLRV